MDEIQFADGFDAPDRLAFGLGAGQLLTVVAGGLLAYAVARSPLPPPVAMPIAASLASVAAVLGWFRVAGRPALDWAVYACLYAVRPRGGRFAVDVTSARVPATTRHRPVMRPRATSPRAPSPRAPRAHPAAAPDADIIPLRPRSGWAGMARPLAVGDATSPATRPLRIGGAHRITFFSLKGGTGRTMLAVELACALASTTRARRDGAEPLQVALLDLDVRCASVAVRLGLAHAGLMEFALSPPDERRICDFMAPHRSGARVLLGPSGLSNPDWPVTAPLLREVLRELDIEGFDVVVMDVSPELCAVTRAALNSSDDVFVVVVPTASGVQDAYRTTEQLRHVGLRHQLRYVVNRARADVDVGVTIADLAGQLVAEVPDDPALADAENSHRVVTMHGESEGARALQRLARRIDSELAFACAT